MKNKGFLSKRLPVPTHKGEGRPTLLPGAVIEGTTSYGSEATHPEIDARPEQNPEVTVRQTGKPARKQDRKPRTTSSNARQKEADQQKRYFFKLLIDSSISEKLDRFFESNPHMNRAVVIRKALVSLREAVISAPTKSPPYVVPQQPSRETVTLRLPSKTVDAIVEANDPAGIEPTTTVLARHVTPLYVDHIKRLLAATSKS